MMKRTAVLFDMDGLMVDTEPLSRTAWDRVLASQGVAIADDLYDRMLGRRTTESVELVLAANRLPWSAAELIDLKTRAFLEILTEGVPAMPGLNVLLDELDRRGLPWGVATSSPRRIAEVILRGLSLDGRCRALAAGDEVVHGKPAPDLYLLAAARLGVASSTCLALEDTAVGCASAAAAGMRAVAVGATAMSAAASPAPGEPFDCAYRRYLSLAEVAAKLDELLGD
jgi:HAD superfamily hydrolase (TIGR01509 family)